jgi:putative NADH-flavin reductase
MRVALMLARRKHQVVGLAFRPDSIPALNHLGLSNAAQCDVRDRGSLYRHFENCDVVINATSSVPLDPARTRYIAEVQVLVFGCLFLSTFCFYVAGGECQCGYSVC